MVPPAVRTAMPGAVFLENGVVTLRTIEESDVAFFHANINDRSIWESLGVQPTPHSESVEREWIRAASTADVAVKLVVCDGERPVG